MMKPLHPDLLGAAICAAALLAAPAATAQQKDFSGRVEFSLRSASSPADSATAAFATADYTDALGNLRLRWQHRWGSVSAELHYVISAEAGPGAGNRAALGALMPPPPPGNLLPLSQTLHASGTRRIVQRIDRLTIGYSSPHFVARLGRQALTWGAGRVFHPMDLVNPFSPATRDTEFKPGTDMLYLQWLFDNGDDLEAIAVPRRARAGGPVSAGASTFGLRYRTSLGELGLEAILARDHGDTTAGIGLSGALAGATWNLELVPTRLSGGGMKTSGLANISTATTVFGRPGLLFAEYSHNGFGVTGAPAGPATLPAALIGRLQRGQVFNTGQDYLALGATLELSPLLSLSGSTIFNLNDGSRLGVGELNWSLDDNTTLTLNAQLPAGARGSEFGGLSLGGAGAPYLAPEKSIGLHLRRYF